MSKYIEQASQVQYVIHSLSESDVDQDGDVGAFWSNENGWGSFQAATLFSTKERMSFNLPMSAKLDAEWMLVEEARDLEANRNLTNYIEQANQQQISIETKITPELLSDVPVNWVGGSRWTFDRGAMPGEPFAFLDGDNETSTAAMVEIQTPGRPVFFEVRKVDGILLSRSEFPDEAAREAERSIENERSLPETQNTDRRPIAGDPRLFIEKLGYAIDTDCDQPGLWIWTAPRDGCDSSFHTAIEALDGAWNDALAQTLAISEISCEEWGQMDFDQQRVAITFALSGWAKT